MNLTPLVVAINYLEDHSEWQVGSCWFPHMEHVHQTCIHWSQYRNDQAKLCPVLCQRSDNLFLVLCHLKMDLLMNV